MVLFSNLGKFEGQIYLGNSEKPLPFPTIEALLLQKKKTKV